MSTAGPQGRDGGSEDVDTTWSRSRHPTNHCHRVPVGDAGRQTRRGRGGRLRRGRDLRKRPPRSIVQPGARSAECTPPPARSLAPDPRWRPASQARCPRDDLEQEVTRFVPATLGPRANLALPRGASLAYRESLGASGNPPLMLLHGLGITADLNWSPAYADLCQRFRVVAPDLPGHGRGIRPWPTFSLEKCTDHMVALADSLGIEKFIACDYSMGSLVAQLIWRRHPDRIAGLVLGSTSRNFLGSPTERLISSLSPAFTLA